MLVAERLSTGEALYETKAFQFGVGWHTLTVFNLYGDPSIRIIPSKSRSRRRYVNSQASPGGDGLSWETAYKCLQDALDKIARLGSVRQIWVAKGTYRPDRGTGDRHATFRLDKGIEIYGGFTGGEKRLDQRDANTNVTVLSGDIGVIGDGSDNSYHVVSFKDTWVGSVIDGFTITGGNANGRDQADRIGGGVYNLHSNPEFRNCVFSDNSAAENGGAIRSSGKWNVLTLDDCVFTGNSAKRGGAMYLECRARVKRCTLSGNSATWGGGIYDYVDSHAILYKCSLWANNASEDGGEVYNCEGGDLTAGFCNIEGGVNGPKCGGVPATDGGGNTKVERRSSFRG
jgi:predicted outer membrane repeat protein